jgi:predicted RNA-binding protein with RPS1 domain
LLQALKSTLERRDVQLQNYIAKLKKFEEVNALQRADIERFKLTIKQVTQAPEAKDLKRIRARATNAEAEVEAMRKRLKLETHGVEASALTSPPTLTLAADMEVEDVDTGETKLELPVVKAGEHPEPARRRHRRATEGLAQHSQEAQKHAVRVKEEKTLLDAQLQAEKQQRARDALATEELQGQLQVTTGGYPFSTWKEMDDLKQKGMNGQIEAECEICLEERAECTC